MSKISKMFSGKNKPDDDLNFDEFDVDLDGYSDAESGERTPASRVFSNTINYATSKVLNSGNVELFLEKSLPDEYGEVRSVADEVTGGVKDLYDGTIKDLKPAFRQLARSLDKIVPGDQDSFLKRKLLNVIEATTDRDGSERGQSEEEAREGSINAVIGDVFKEMQSSNAQVEAAKVEYQQAKEQKADRKEFVKDQIDTDRYTGMFGRVDSIATGVDRIVGYNENISTAYQKKSLELQLRSYYLQKDLTDASKVFFEQTRVQNESIVKNTALPEFVKITESERFREHARNSLYDAVTQGLFGDRQYVKDVFSNIRGKIKDKIESIKFGFDSVGSMADMYQTQKDMDEISGTKTTFGKFVGDMGVTEAVKHFIIGKPAAYLKKKAEDEPDSYIGKVSNKIKDAHVVTKDLRGYGNQFARHDWEEEESMSDGFFSRMWYKFLGGVSENLVTGSPSLSVDAGRGVDTLNQPAIFDNNIKRSITEVIPKFLGIIHAETKALRRQSYQLAMVTERDKKVLKRFPSFIEDPEPNIYDVRKGSFTTAKLMTKKFIDKAKLLKEKSSIQSTEALVKSMLEPALLRKANGKGKDKDITEINKDDHNNILTITTRLARTNKPINEDTLKAEVKKLNIDDEQKARLHRLISQSVETHAGRSALSEIGNTNRQNDIASNVEIVKLLDQLNSGGAVDNETVKELGIEYAEEAGKYFFNEGKLVDEATKSGVGDNSVKRVNVNSEVDSLSSAKIKHEEKIASVLGNFSTVTTDDLRKYFLKDREDSFKNQKLLLTSNIEKKEKALESRKAALGENPSPSSITAFEKFTAKIDEEKAKLKVLREEETKVGRATEGFTEDSTNQKREIIVSNLNAIDKLEGPLAQAQARQQEFNADDFSHIETVYQAKQALASEEDKHSKLVKSLKDHDNRTIGKPLPKIREKLLVDISKSEANIKYLEKFIKDNEVGSDINIKNNIKKLTPGSNTFSPTSALNAVNNTPVSEWTYKKGEGDGKTHIGPMAQDINRKLGDNAAPGGKVVDVNEIGKVNATAFQKLNDEVNDIAEKVDKKDQFTSDINTKGGIKKLEGSINNKYSDPVSLNGATMLNLQHQSKQIDSLKAKIDNATEWKPQSTGSKPLNSYSVSNEVAGYGLGKVLKSLPDQYLYSHRKEEDVLTPGKLAMIDQDRKRVLSFDQSKFAVAIGEYNSTGKSDYMSNINVGPFIEEVKKYKSDYDVATDQLRNSLLKEIFYANIDTELKGQLSGLTHKHTVGELKIVYDASKVEGAVGKKNVGILMTQVYKKLDEFDDRIEESRKTLPRFVPDKTIYHTENGSFKNDKDSNLVGFKNIRSNKESNLENDAERNKPIGGIENLQETTDSVKTKRNRISVKLGGKVNKSNINAARSRLPTTKGPTATNTIEDNTPSTPEEKRNFFKRMFNTSKDNEVDTDQKDALYKEIQDSNINDVVKYNLLTRLNYVETSNGLAIIEAAFRTPTEVKNILDRFDRKFKLKDRTGRALTWVDDLSGGRINIALDKVNGLGSDVKDAVTNVFEDPTTAGKTAAAMAQVGLNTVKDSSIGSAVTHVFNNPTDALNTATSTVSALASNTKDHLTGLDEENKKKLIEEVNNLSSSNVLRPLLIKLANEATNNAQIDGYSAIIHSKENLGEKLVNLKALAGDKLSPAIDNVATTFNIDLDSVTNSIKNMASSVGTSVNNAATAVGDSVANATDILGTNQTNKVIDSIKNQGSSIYDTDKTTFGRGSLLTKAGHFLTGTVESLKERYKNYDIYKINEDGKHVLVLKATLFRDNYYKNAEGEALTSYKDIIGKVYTPNGEVVLDYPDVKNGLYNQNGELLDIPAISKTGKFYDFKEIGKQELAARYFNKPVRKFLAKFIDKQKNDDDSFYNKALEIFDSQRGLAAKTRAFERLILGTGFKYLGKYAKGLAMSPFKLASAGAKYGLGKVKNIGRDIRDGYNYGVSVGSSKGMSLESLTEKIKEVREAKERGEIVSEEYITRLEKEREKRATIEAGLENSINSDFKKKILTSNLAEIRQILDEYKANGYRLNHAEKILVEKRREELRKNRGRVMGKILDEHGNKLDQIDEDGSHTPSKVMETFSSDKRFRKKITDHTRALERHVIAKSPAAVGHAYNAGKTVLGYTAKGVGKVGGFVSKLAFGTRAPSHKASREEILQKATDIDDPSSAKKAGNWINNAWGGFKNRRDARNGVQQPTTSITPQQPVVTSTTTPVQNNVQTSVTRHQPSATINLPTPQQPVVTSTTTPVQNNVQTSVTRHQPSATINLPTPQQPVVTSTTTPQPPVQSTLVDNNQQPVVDNNKSKRRIVIPKGKSVDPDKIKAARERVAVDNKVRQDFNKTNRNNIAKADPGQYKDKTTLGDILGGIKTLGKGLLGVLTTLAAVKGAGELVDAATDALTPDGKSTKKSTKKPPVYKKAGVLAKTGRALATAGRIGAQVGLRAIGILGGPVTAGILAVGAAAYYGYKYYRAKQVEDYTNLRLYQYGIKDVDSSFADKILEIEDSIISSGRARFTGNDVTIDDSAIDTELLQSTFELTGQDDPHLPKVLTWFRHRFLPVLKTHLVALNTKTMVFKLSKLDDASPQSQLEFLTVAEYEDGPYTLLTSPFKSLDTLTSTKTDVITQVNLIKDKLKKALEKEKTDAIAKEKEAQAELDKRAALEKKVQEELAKSKPDEKKDKKLDIPPPPVPAIANDSKIPSNIVGDSGGGEKSVGTPVDQTTPTTSGVSNLPTADGPLLETRVNDFFNVKASAKIDNVNPSLLSNLRGAAEEYNNKTGKKLYIESAFRSTEEQKALHNKDPKNAKPGRSMHEFGLAVDASSKQLAEMDKLGILRKYGLTLPIGKEPWHVEPAGVQLMIEKAKANPQLASTAIEAGAGKGGGGYATLDNSIKGKRDMEYARKLLLADTNVVKETNTEPKTGEDIINPVKNNQSTVDSQVSNVVAPEATNTTPTTATDDSKNLTSPKVKDDKEGYLFGDGLPKAEPIVEQPKPEKPSDTKVLPEAKVPVAKPKAFKPTASDANNTSVIPKATPGSSDVLSIIKEAANKVGEDPTLLTTIAKIESTLNPKATSSVPGSTAKGLFQFNDGTWKEKITRHGAKYGLTKDVTQLDPQASSLMAAETIKEISRKFTDPVFKYMAYFLGNGGANKILKAPTTKTAAELLPEAASKNQKLFYDNGNAISVLEFQDKIREKLSKNGFNASPAVATNDVKPEVKTKTDGFVPTSVKGDTVKNESGMASEGFSKTSFNANKRDTVKNESGMASEGFSKTSFNANEPSVDTGNSSINVNSLLPKQPSVYANQPTNKPQPNNTLNAMSTGISNISDTLSKSLDVQTQTLDAIVQLSKNLSPEMFNRILSSINTGDKKPIKEITPEPATNRAPSKTSRRPEVNVNVTRSMLGSTDMRRPNG